jgi:hypothetical protein
VEFFRKIKRYTYSFVIMMGISLFGQKELALVEYLRKKRVTHHDYGN